MSVRVKICGLTRLQDVIQAQLCGADALGFVFAPSRRQIETGLALELAGQVGDGCLKVGLFLDQDATEIERVINQVPLDLLQFHGQEDNRFCAQFGRPFLKAIAMGGDHAAAELGAYPDAAGLLLDSHRPGQRGGSGVAFDWAQPVISRQPLWLAGGLTPDNVGEAVRLFKPYAVDVSSGVEDEPGVKNHGLIERFISNARNSRNVS